MAIYRRRAARRRVVLIVLLAVSLIMISTDFRDGASSSTLRKILLEMVRPVESVVGAVTRPVGQFVSGIFNAGSLRAENEQLRKEVEELRRQKLDAARATRENAELRELVNLANPQKLDAVTARVASVRATNFEWTISIAAGTKNGIADGNPVVSNAGLVGRVTDATSRGAKVIRATAPRARGPLCPRPPAPASSVGVRDVRSGVTGVVSGQGREPLRLELVDASADLRRGDVLVTSGFEGSRFPADVPVGRVRAVKKNKTGLVLSATVDPLGNATRADFVSVLLWTPPAG